MDSTAAFFSVLGYGKRTHKMCRVRKVEGLFSYFIFYPPWHVKYEMLYATFLSLDSYLWIVKKIQSLNESQNRMRIWMRGSKVSKKSEDISMK